MIPTTIPGALDACRALLADLGDADGLALGSALAAPGGPVQQMAACLAVLRDMSALTDAGVLALAGCAKLMAAHGFTGRTINGELVTAGDAADVLLTRGAEISAAVARVMPPMPVPELITALDG